MTRQYVWVTYDDSIQGPSLDQRRVVQVASTNQLNDRDPVLTKPPPSRDGLVVEAAQVRDIDLLHDLMARRQLYWNLTRQTTESDAAWIPDPPSDDGAIIADQFNHDIEALPDMTSARRDCIRSLPNADQRYARGELLQMATECPAADLGRTRR